MGSVEEFARRSEAESHRCQVRKGVGSFDEGGVYEAENRVSHSLRLRVIGTRPSGSREAATRLAVSAGTFSVQFPLLPLALPWRALLE